MKVLHVIPTYYPAFARGGPIVSVHNLNKWLVKQGVDVTVYTTDLDIPEETLRNEEVLVDGVKVRYFKTMFKPWQCSWEMYRALKEHTGDFDLVHITSTFLAASALGSRFARKRHIPYVISPRGNLMVGTMKRHTLLKRAYIALIERRVLKNAAAVHFTVPMEEAEYKQLGFPLRKALIIPNGIETGEYDKGIWGGSFREKWNIGKDTKLVLALGRIDWKKGFDTLIPALAEVVRRVPEAKLVIAGSDNDGYRKEVEKFMRNWNMEKHVIFTGLLTGGDKLSALRDADVFALPSYSENFGMAVVESLYMHLPVVITPEVGVAPYVKEAEAGLVVEKNIEKFSAALVALLQDDARRAYYGTNGRRLVEERFVMERIAGEWSKAYSELV